MRWADRHSISYLGGWFIAPDLTCEEGPTLMSDYAGTPTRFGIGLREHLREFEPANFARGAKLRGRSRVSRGCSSAGRASRWQREGQGFEPPQPQPSRVQIQRSRSADEGDECCKSARVLARDAGHAGDLRALERAGPFRTRRLVALSLAIALALLAAVWVVAGLLTPDLTPIHLPGLTEPSDPGDLLPILWRNSLVLALHATACVAGFIAGASMPIAAAQRTGISRWIHVKAGELAILFVCAVTLFSLWTQALYLGFQGSTIAFQLQISRAALILSVLPHALLELTALFLPLAAWLIASRRGEWNQLLAATLVTVLIAIPSGRRGDDRGLRLASHPRGVLAVHLTCSSRNSRSR